MQSQTMQELNNKYNHYIEAIRAQQATVTNQMSDSYRKLIKYIINNDHFDNQQNAEQRLNTTTQNELLFSGIPSNDSNTGISDEISSLSSDTSLNDEKRNKNDSKLNRKRKSKDIQQTQPKKKKRKSMCMNAKQQQKNKDKENIAPNPSPSCKSTTKPKVRCKVCNKLYATKGILQTHMRLHTGLRPYECNTCKRSFPQKSNLLAHVKSAHKHDTNSKKQYQCDICHRWYTRKEALKAHKNVCKKEKDTETEVELMH